MHFIVNQNSIVAWMSLLKQARFLRLSDCRKIWAHSNLIHKQTLNGWILFPVVISTVHFNVCPYHVTHAFHSEYTLYSCLNVKDLFAWNRHDIWRLSGCNGIRTHNHLILKRTQPFTQTGLMIELCCEQFFAQVIWLYVFIMSPTRLRVYPHSMIVWMSRNSSFLKTGAIFED